MCILPGTGPAFFLFEDTQLESPGGNTSEEHHHKLAVKTDQEEHGPFLKEGEKKNKLFEKPPASSP